MERKLRPLKVEEVRGPSFGAAAALVDLDFFCAVRGMLSSKSSAEARKRVYIRDDFESCKDAKNGRNR
jgi:hypothetical protein